MHPRRAFLKQLGLVTAGTTLIPGMLNDLLATESKKLFFEISLAEWSLHKALYAKKITNLDFPVLARKEYGVSVVEYVNSFFKDKANDTSYLNELLKRCKDHGIKNHLIMCDGEGDLGDTNETKRLKAVDNHKKWVEAAKYLGCTTIRVNAAGRGTAGEVKQAAIDGLARLGEYGEKEGINVIVENHGGYSSNGEWLASVMKGINKKNVGTLPDFGNFCIKQNPTTSICEESYDRYKGTAELMPFAKGVSAKSENFDKKGNCIETDYYKMLKIVKDAGFTGYIGIEYSGPTLSEDAGIKATKKLLEKVGKRM